ncbi:MAG TPA: transcriptional repressor [bacterium]|nr:transcriptional repressor [bacterium]
MFQRRCRKARIPFTIQRRKTYEMLLNRMDHPTADEVFENVKEVLPGISRMTVYRVLELLVDFGLVNKVFYPGTAGRYDANPHRHHHLVCLNCTMLIDFESKDLDGLEIPAAAGEYSFDVHDYLVQFRGLCARCRKKRKTIQQEDVHE